MTHPITSFPPFGSAQGRLRRESSDFQICRFIQILLLLIPFLFASPSLSEEINAYTNGSIIKADTEWSGTVTVDGVVSVPEGITLKIAPGTRVLFKKSAVSLSDASEVLIPGSGIKVEGKIVAIGEMGREITFTSAAGRPASAEPEAGRPAAPGDWGCIFIDHTKGSVFTHCRFEYSAYTIHAHFSQLDLSRCTITHNEDGSRLGQCRASYDHCDIKNNTGKGLNFRQSKVNVSFCEITGNRDGIFLNEKDAACLIEHNNICRNSGMDIRLGDFHKEDIKLTGDWWGTPDLNEIKKKVYDKSADPEIGRVEITPLTQEVVGAWPDGPEIKVKWKFKTGAYVDGGAIEKGGAVYFGSWDKDFYAVRADNGELIWKFTTGDCVDCTPAIDGGKVYFGSWDRNIYCLDEKDGKLIWKFQMPPSNFDDHRQASPVVLGNWGVASDTLFMGGFNGVVYALDSKTGIKKWEFRTGGPIRGKPCLDLHSWMAKKGYDKAPRVYVGSGDGNLYAFYLGGTLMWKTPTGGAVNSSPNGVPLVGSADGNLYCFDWFQGKEKWHYNTGSRIEYSSPLIFKGLVYIGDCNGTLHAVNKDTGQAAWTFTGGGGIYSSPVVAGGEIIYGDNAGGVYALDPKTGGLKAFFKAGDAVQGISAGEKGVVYASSRDGYLYALEIAK